MLTVRAFEEEVQRLFQKGEVLGTTHLCIGQEAVSAGVEAALRGDDMVAATYRGHAQAIARGVSVEALAAEMLGRATGICGGRAGSMNVVDLSHNLLGCFGIIGGTVATAIGAGLSLRGTGRVAVAYFGDGTANHGYFHECLNFAKVRTLPVVFVCENNGYGEFTPWREVTAGQDLLARAEALAIPAEQADGMDVRDVHRVAAAAVAAARAGSGPRFIECLTYRFVGHSRSDPGLYRPAGELERWRERDPLLVARAALAGELGVADGTLDAEERTARALVDTAFVSALAAPPPDPARPATAYADA
ncbi:MAG: thiamine pyrophosphate-dependent dehydrogenase E1 component subunit alpha [Solirubrobacteraceae bacterium]